MWTKRMQFLMGDEAFRAIGITEAPSNKLSKYISQHASGLADWFVVIDGDASGVSLRKADIDRIKACRISGTLHVQGHEIRSKEVSVSIYSD